MNQEPCSKENAASRVVGFVENIILYSRYLLVPLLCALLFVLFTITLDFLKVLVHANEASRLTEHILQALELVDITMIGNFIWLISAGSYYVFVDATYQDKSKPEKKRPRALSHLSSGLLKEKMAGSLIGVSSVHLLETFLHLSIAKEKVIWENIGVLLAIHGMFIIGLLAFNYANKADYHTHNQEKKGKENENEQPVH